MAVLDVIEQERLLANARDVGAYAVDRLRGLAAKHDIIGNVRGAGLFFGAEFVTDRRDKTPAAEKTTRIVNEMRERGVLMGKIGIHANTLKIRPPMPFSRDNADLMIETLDQVLSTL